MRISDWSSDVCSSDLPSMIADRARLRVMLASVARTFHVGPLADCFFDPATALCLKRVTTPDPAQPLTALCEPTRCPNACITARHRPAWERAVADRSEEHTSELQSLMRISYAVFCLKKNNNPPRKHN